MSAYSPAPYRPRDPLHHTELYVAKTLLQKYEDGISRERVLAGAGVEEVAG